MPPVPSAQVAGCVAQRCRGSPDGFLSSSTLSPSRGPGTEPPPKLRRGSLGTGTARWFQLSGPARMGLAEQSPVRVCVPAPSYPYCTGCLSYPRYNRQRRIGCNFLCLISVLVLRGKKTEEKSLQLYPLSA